MNLQVNAPTRRPSQPLCPEPWTLKPTAATRCHAVQLRRARTLACRVRTGSADLDLAVLMLLLSRRLVVGQTLPTTKTAGLQLTGARFLTTSAIHTYGHATPGQDPPSVMGPPMFCQAPIPPARS